VKSKKVNFGTSVVSKYMPRMGSPTSNSSSQGSNSTKVYNELNEKLRVNKLKADLLFKGTSDLTKHRNWYKKYRERYDHYHYFSPKDLYQIKSIMKNEGILCKKYNYSLDKQVQLLCCYQS